MDPLPGPQQAGPQGGWSSGKDTVLEWPRAGRPKRAAQGLGEKAQKTRRGILDSPACPLLGAARQEPPKRGERERGAGALGPARLGSPGARPLPPYLPALRKPCLCTPPGDPRGGSRAPQHARTHARMCSHTWAHMQHTCTRTRTGTHVLTRTHAHTHAHMHTRPACAPPHAKAPSRCCLLADSPRSRRVVSTHMADPQQQQQQQAVETLHGMGQGRGWPLLTTGWGRHCCFSHAPLTPEDGRLQRPRDGPDACHPQVSQAPHRPTAPPLKQPPISDQPQLLSRRPAEQSLCSLPPQESHVEPQALAGDPATHRQAPIDTPLPSHVLPTLRLAP